MLIAVSYLVKEVHNSVSYVHASLKATEIPLLRSLDEIDDSRMEATTLKLVPLPFSSSWTELSARAIDPAAWARLSSSEGGSAFVSFRQNLLLGWNAGARSTRRAVAVYCYFRNGREWGHCERERFYSFSTRSTHVR